MRADVILPRRLEEKIDSEVEAGERIEWTEMPVPRFFTPVSTAAFLFAIPWTLFAVFWMFGAAGFQIPDFKQGVQVFNFFPLFGVPFVLIGLGMLSAPFWAYRNALKTVYVITDRRAIIISGGWSTTIRSYPPRKLQDLVRKEHRDGTGDVIFERRAAQSSNGNRQTEDIGFLRINRPKEVELMLKKLAEQDRGEGGS